MPALPLSELLITVVLGLQVVGLLTTFVVWRRQKSSDVSASDLQKGQQHLESLVRDEMAHNRSEAGEQARAGRDEAGASAGKIAEQFGVLQRDNLAFREHFSERLGTNFNTFAKDLAGQIEVSGAASKDEVAQLRAELFETLHKFGGALTRQISEATDLQDRRFEQFEKRLIALGERNADQIHSLDDAIVEHLENLQKEAAQNWDAKRIAADEATRQARLELREALRDLPARSPKTSRRRTNRNSASSIRSSGA